MKDKLHFRWIETPLGISILSWQEEKLVSFVLPCKEKEQAFARFAQKCQPLFASFKEERNDPFFLEAPIQSYFQGQKTALSTYPFFLEIYPPFTQKVLIATASIPHGSTRTYGEIARTVGVPQAPRAVGQSLGRNLLLLFIPCHRVVAQNSLGGFGEGLRMKVLLLSIEFSNLVSGSLYQGTLQESTDPLIDQEGDSSIHRSPLQEIERNNCGKEHFQHHFPWRPKVNGSNH